MRFVTITEDVELRMWEKTMMPESTMVETNGKKEFRKTGTEVEMTTYTFRDGFGEKLVMLSKNNDWRKFESKKVKLTVEIVYNDFQKKNRTVLANVEAFSDSL